jgi:hypothetical protein
MNARRALCCCGEAPLNCLDYFAFCFGNQRRSVTFTLFHTVEQTLFPYCDDLSTNPQYEVRFTETFEATLFGTYDPKQPIVDCQIPLQGTASYQAATLTRTVVGQVGLCQDLADCTRQTRIWNGNTFPLSAYLRASNGTISAPPQMSLVAGFNYTGADILEFLGACGTGGNTSPISDTFTAAVNWLPERCFQAVQDANPFPFDSANFSGPSGNYALETYVRSGYVRTLF